MSGDLILAEGEAVDQPIEAPNDMTEAELANRDPGYRSPIPEVFLG